MKPTRFLRNIFTDTPAAMRSLKLVARKFYGQCYWFLRPKTPMAYRLPTGGLLLLEPQQSFTACFWPDVDNYEPDVRAFLDYLLQPGDTFIDCGANVGYFSVQAGALVGERGTVVSIEANPVAYKLLKRNLEVNRTGIPLHCALTSRAGEVELFMPNDWDILSSLRSNSLVAGNPLRFFKVRGRTLDEIVIELKLQKVNVVKIDIEGGELDVLRSSPQLLSSFRPFVVFEYGLNTWPSFGASSESLKHLAAKYDYVIRLFDQKESKLVPVRDEIWKRSFVNLVMVPKEVSINGNGNRLL